MNNKFRNMLAVAVVVAGFTAMANPSLVVDKVEQAGGVATITYTASGLDAYDLSAAKLVFEITANGTTKVYTNATRVVEGVNTAQITFKPDFGGVDLLAQVSYHARIADLGGGATDPTTDPTVGPHGAPIPGAVQLWPNGPLFAEWNVGASAPEEAGYYFWWGDTVGYTNTTATGDFVSVLDGAGFLFNMDNTPTYMKTVSQLMSAGYIDSTGVLAAEHDAATAHLGNGWRMPTDAEIQALINKTTTTWTTQNGVAGRLITGTVGEFTKKSIFIPAAGRCTGKALLGPSMTGDYWSSAPDSDSRRAWQLELSSGIFKRSCDYSHRYLGYPVRAVRDCP